ncbi:hypothetical protein AN4750.2 [Aspergillus nidulans FGSC A4]|nr:hypothetical protein AN4750.2 [Aspergillus nidulans FGSC A4]|eukprot:XP_662354.1 hypothetical protein AN4750.2 [Aspergillus nidulans FGSC A4]
MLNRLETNIGRLETRLLELGLDLDREGSVQSPRQLAVSDKPRSPSSLSIPGSENIVEEGLWRCGPCPEATLEDSGVPRTFPSMDREDDVPQNPEVNKSPFLDDFNGLLIPRCIMGGPADRKIPVLSREGLQWMNQKAGMTPRISSGIHSNATSFGILGDDFPKAFCPLPSKEEAESLLYQYLQNFNCLCPLFEQAKLTSLFNEDNLNTALRVPSCWASVNVVFALGIAFRVKDTRSVVYPGAPRDDRSWEVERGHYTILRRYATSEKNILDCVLAR